MTMMTNEDEDEDEDEEEDDDEDDDDDDDDCLSSRPFPRQPWGRDDPHPRGPRLLKRLERKESLWR